MQILRATLETFEKKILLIGYQGENECTQVRIDASDVFTEYPNATPSMIIQPFSGDGFPCFVARDGNDVVWEITSTILSFRGDGEAQLTFIKDSVVKKSAVGNIRVRRSLAVTGETPTPVAQWIDAANAKLAEVDAQIVELEDMVDTATDAATRAEQSASTASAEATSAAGSAATAAAKANEATTAAGTATAKAGEAQNAVLAATDKASAAAESERIATAKAAEASQSASTAFTKATEAAESARTASTKAGEAIDAAGRAEQSAQKAGYMYMEIVDGHLIFNRTSNVSVVDFALVDGHLIVEVA